MSEKKYPRRWTKKDREHYIEIREPGGLIQIVHAGHQGQGHLFEKDMDERFARVFGWTETFDHHEVASP